MANAGAESRFVAARDVRRSTVAACTIAEQFGGALGLHDGRIDQRDAVAEHRAEVRLEHG